MKKENSPEGEIRSGCAQLPYDRFANLHQWLIAMGHTCISNPINLFGTDVAKLYTKSGQHFIVAFKTIGEHCARTISGAADGKHTELFD